MTYGKASKAELISTDHIDLEYEDGDLDDDLYDY